MSLLSQVGLQSEFAIPVDGAKFACFWGSQKSMYF